MQTRNDVVLVALPEAARRMSLGLSTLKLLIANGKLRSLKVGKRRLVPVSAIDDSVREFLAASQTEPKRAT